MSPIRIAVIGVGRMGQTHAENLVRRVGGAQLVAVTTSDEERARSWCAVWDEGTRLHEADAPLRRGRPAERCVSGSRSGRAAPC